MHSVPSNTQPRWAHAPGQSNGSRRLTTSRSKQWERREAQKNGDTSIHLLDIIRNNKLKDAKRYCCSQNRGGSMHFEESPPLVLQEERSHGRAAGDRGGENLAVDGRGGALGRRRGRDRGVGLASGVAGAGGRVLDLVAVVVEVGDLAREVLRLALVRDEARERRLVHDRVQRREAGGRVAEREEVARRELVGVQERRELERLAAGARVEVRDVLEHGDDLGARGGCARAGVGGVVVVVRARARGLLVALVGGRDRGEHGERGGDERGELDHLGVGLEEEGWLA